MVFYSYNCHKTVCCNSWTNTKGNQIKVNKIWTRCEPTLTTGCYIIIIVSDVMINNKHRFVLVLSWCVLSNLAWLRGNALVAIKGSSQYWYITVYRQANTQVCSQPPRLTRPSTLCGTVKWVTIEQMATVGGVVSSSLRVDTQPKSLSLVWGLAASWVLRLNSSREPSELSRWQCHDNSTTNTVVGSSSDNDTKLKTYGSHNPDSIPQAHNLRWIT